MGNVFLVLDGELQESQKLWRYMDLSKFISLLEKEALWLARSDTFRDKREGRFPDDMRQTIEEVFKSFDESDDSRVRNADDFQDYIQKNTFLSCWHKNFDENMVMWEIYGRENNAVAIQTTINDLANSIDDSNLRGYSLSLKNVSYLRPVEISGVVPYEECFFIKRPHFSFEQEVRISFDTYCKENPTKNTPFGYYLPVSIQMLITKVLIHPDSPEWFFEAINSITTKYGIHAPVERGVCGNN